MTDVDDGFTGSGGGEDGGGFGGDDGFGGFGGGDDQGGFGGGTTEGNGFLTFDDPTGFDDPFVTNSPTPSASA